MVEATTGNMLTAPNVKHFMDWLNEINRWGLSVHGPACNKDVQFLGLDAGSDGEQNVRQR